MCRAEYDRLERDARWHVSGPRRELPLEVAAKDHLFAETCRTRQQKKHCDFQASLRQQEFRCLNSAEVHRKRERHQHCVNDNPEQQRDTYVPPKVLPAQPFSADDFTQRHLVPPEPEQPDVTEQQEFVYDGRKIENYPTRQLDSLGKMRLGLQHCTSMQK